MTSGHSHDDRDARIDSRRIDSRLANSVHADDRLAHAARNAHAASLDNLSPRVRAQLAQRRRAALAEHARPSAARHWPMLALGSAAALTLVIGLFLLRGPGETRTPPQGEVAVTPPGIAPVPTPTAPAPATATEPVVASTDTPEPAVESILIDDELPPELLAAEFSGADEAMGFDTLEENPDFYLWLGSDNAQADVTESL